MVLTVLMTTCTLPDPLIFLRSQKCEVHPRTSEDPHSGGLPVSSVFTCSSRCVSSFRCLSSSKLDDPSIVFSPNISISSSESMPLDSPHDLSFTFSLPSSVSQRSVLTDLNSELSSIFTGLSLSCNEWKELSNTCDTLEEASFQEIFSFLSPYLNPDSRLTYDHDNNHLFFDEKRILSSRDVFTQLTQVIKTYCIKPCFEDHFFLKLTESLNNTVYADKFTPSFLESNCQIIQFGRLHQGSKSVGASMISDIDIKVLFYDTSLDRNESDCLRNSIRSVLETLKTLFWDDYRLELELHQYCVESIDDVKKYILKDPIERSFFDSIKESYCTLCGSLDLFNTVFKDSRVRRVSVSSKHAVFNTLLGLGTHKTTISTIQNSSWNGQFGQKKTNENNWQSMDLKALLNRPYDTSTFFTLSSEDSDSFFFLNNIGLEFQNMFEKTTLLSSDFIDSSDMNDSFKNRIWDVVRKVDAWDQVECCFLDKDTFFSNFKLNMGKLFSVLTAKSLTLIKVFDPFS